MATLATTHVNSSHYVAEIGRRASVDVDGGVAEHRGADGGAQRRLPVNQKRERLGD